MIAVDIRLQRGTFALKTAFTAPSHGITALFGRSGAGKSTVIAALAGLTRPDFGRIAVGDAVFFDSEAGIDLAVEARRIGLVFQDSRLFPHLTVAGNLRYGLRRAPRADRRIGWEAVLDLLGIAALLNRRPGDLSGGEKQRVALGRALLSQPRLLLMDEPLAALDATRKAGILPYLESLRDDLGLPILYVSHALDEVVRLADTVVLIEDGQIRATGTVSALSLRLDLGGLGSREEAGAVLDGRVLGEARSGDGAAAAVLTLMAIPGGVLALPLRGLAPGTPLRLRVPARDVIVALAAPAGISVNNVLPARIAEIATPVEGAVDLRLALGEAGEGGLIARITVSSALRLWLEVGQPVHALVKSVALDRHALAGRPPAGVLHL